VSQRQLRILSFAKTALLPGEIGVDLFAGGGGWSLGFQWATGVPPAVAVNHDENAIAMHVANHPETEHHHTDVFDVDPLEATRGRAVGWLHLSPDCTHFSRAKGGKPRSQKIRALATVAIPWAEKVRPRIISLENVAEFVTWGPLDDDGNPIKARAGETFREWVAQLEALGYAVQWRVLNAADYGAPTSRRRLFVIARRDGLPIRWPKPTHGPKGTQPYRTAAECIDWSIPVPSIFDRKKPLADATLRRIAAGVKKFVLENPKPFLVNLTHGGRLENIDEPFRTITAAHRGEKALVAPTLIQTSYGERKGQKPRVLDLHKPLGTIVAGGTKHALVAAMLKHYGGVVGVPIDRPLGTITAKDHHAVLACHVESMYSNSKGHPVDGPLPTVTAQSNHHALVAAFMCKYYGSDVHGQAVDEPIHTIPTVDRFGLVTVVIDGETYVIVDIGMRMLRPRELARGQGFPDSYVLVGSGTQQVARVGNSVSPDVAKAVVRANLSNDGDEAEAAA
jgi:DNA (cytosine-5)-methyltransferase 1